MIENKSRTTKVERCESGYYVYIIGYRPYSCEYAS